jgi:hypothetical protein
MNIKIRKMGKKQKKALKSNNKEKNRRECTDEKAGILRKIS